MTRVWNPQRRYRYHNDKNEVGINNMVNEVEKKEKFWSGFEVDCLITFYDCVECIDRIHNDYSACTEISPLPLSSPGIH